jgi:PAS domain S-box-containing protein
MQASMLDALPAHIALLDPDGVILTVNESWKRFAAANVLQSPSFGVGSNYLEVCERATGDCSEEAGEAGRGLRRVLRGEAPEFILEYPCHSPTEQRWFRLMVTPVSTQRRAGVVVMHINITERRLAEEALRASEARLIAAQAVAKVGSWETDLTTFAVHWSAETHRIFGTDPAAVAPTHAGFLALVHPEDRAAVDRAFQQSLAANGTHAIEHRLLMPDGRTKFVEEHWQVFRDPAARPLRAIGTCRDITESKQAEQRVAEAQRFNAALIEASPLAIIVYRASGEGVMANEAARHVLGAPSVEAVRSKNFRELEVWQRTGLLAAAEAALASGQPCEREIRTLDSFGKDIWLHARLIPLNYAGETYLFGFFDDIRHRKLAEEERNRLFNLSLDLLCVAGFDGRLRQVNPAWTQTLGWTAEELTSRPMLDFIHPDDQATTQSARAKILRGESSRGFENRYRCKDGSYRWLSWSVHPLTDLQQVFAVAHDVTGRRQIEETLNRTQSLARMAGRLARIGAWSVDLKEGRIFWSDEVSAIHGMPAGHRPTIEEGVNFYAPEHRALVAEEFGACAREGRPFDRELQIITRAGQRVWVRVIGEAVRHAAGEIVGVQGAFQDITERRLEEEKRQQTSILSRIGGRLARVGGWALDLPDHRVFWSDELCEILDYPPGVVPPLEEALTLYPPGAREQITAGLTACIQAGTPFDLEIEIDTARRRRLWVRVVGEAERGADGAIKRVLGAFQDVTHLRLARDKLRREESLMALAGKVSKVAGWSLTAPDMKLYWSRQVWEMVDYPAGQEPAPDELLQYYAPDSRKKLSRAIARCAKAGHAFDLELQLTTPAGRSMWARVAGEADYDAQGRIQAVHGAFSDITARKQSEQELRRTNRALQVLTSCNEALIRAEQEKELLGEICQIAVAQGGYRMAWVGYAQEDEQRTIAPIAHAGVEEGYLAAQKVTWDGAVASGQGPAGQAIRSGRAVVCEDFSREPAFEPWRTLARERAYAGTICLPLREAGRTFGLLGLYVGAVTPTGTEELKLLQELADDLAFGILNLRARLERRRAQEALRASEEEFRQVTEALPQIVWVTRPDGWHIHFNQRWLDYTGLTMAESLGHGWNPPFHPDDRPRAAARWKAATDSGEPYEIEYRLRRADGVYRWMLGRAVPLRNAGGAVVKWLGTCTDIDDFKRAQAQIVEQAGLLDKAQDAIVVRDLTHHITFWNKSAERFYGWSAAEAVGRSVRELLYFDPGVFDQAMTELLKQGEWTGELVQLRKSGERLTIEGRWTLVRDEAGRPRAVLAINTDITERKNLEQQFLRAQRMESIGTLAGGIAHDLNNLLAPIMMGVELLRQFDPNPKILPVIDNMQQSARRGADLVKQVLSFARGVEGTRMPLQVGHIIREVQSIMENTFPKNIAIEADVAKDLWLVLADPTQLNQVLLNLCVNARDALANGGRLELKARNIEIDPQYAAMNRGVVPGRYVAIHVIDNGCGMPPDVVDRIFEPFFTTKELGKGTGLGLSTVLGIVRSHGGFVNVYSEPGKGSTFKVHLPAQTDSAATQALTALVEALPRGQGELILLVDDEANVREITKATLETFGYRVVTAEDGAQAVALYALRRAEIAGVITDMMMPVMDGPVLIAALRRINPDVRIIAASGLNANANVARAATAGVNHFLAKPYSADALLALLKTLLTGNNGGTGSRPPC